MQFQERSWRLGRRWWKGSKTVTKPPRLKSKQEMVGLTGNSPWNEWKSRDHVGIWFGHLYCVFYCFYLNCDKGGSSLISTAFRLTVEDWDYVKEECDFIKEDIERGQNCLEKEDSFLSWIRDGIWMYNHMLMTTMVREEYIQWNLSLIHISEPTRPY